MHKILAIDDKMDNLITLSALLKNLMPGCSVITAQSGMEGIEMARTELPDAILLDVKMPDMDGFETCCRLMSDESTQHIPVIMITAIKTDPESRIKGLEIGANAFLAKPIDQHELVSQVKVALRIKKAEDALREQRNSLDEMVRERTAALRESEERYRKAFMTSPDSFVITRLSDGMFVSVNKGFTEITGYAAEEVIGKTSLEINIWKNPEDRIKIVERLKAKGEVRNYEACFLAKNREFYGLVSASIIELNGEPHILNVTRDITDRKEAEDALTHSHDLMRYIIEHNRSAVAVHDRDLRYIYVSKRYLDDYKVDIRDVIGKHHYDVFPYLPQKWRDVHQKALSGEISSAEDDPYVREDGTVDWTRWECRPWYEANGSIGGIIIYTEVITERKRAEQAKAKLEGQLQRAQKMESIGSLAGGIAHDLNNILFPISGLSEMLLDDMPPDNPAFENIEQIYKSAQRGSDLVKQILSFSRQGNPQKLPIRIQPILKEALKLAQATIPRNIEVKSHINMDCGMVSADPTQIHQIVMNLITNAFHAVEQTGGTIDIALKETAIESFAEKEDLPFHAIPGDLLTGRYACITVSDTGTGIDQTQIDKIFDPYFTTKELGKGTGLGLSVVHGIIKEHGGDIRVYSELGKGTVFHVYLPLLADVKDIKTAAITRKYPTGHERILLVDDEEPIVLLEQMMLERLGYQVTVRTSSPDALAAFKANPDHFDLVISDRGMPNMTGEQLARELISIKPEIPIIICTGFSDENDEKRARGLGVKGFLMKPVTIGDMAEMVRKVLDEVKGSTQG
jgi:PAS domain S-box-containing protein